LECDTLKNVVLGCAEIDKSFAAALANNSKLDTYVVFDDSKKIEYLNLSGEVIGMEIPTHRKSIKPGVSRTLQNKSIKVKKHR
jgi:hypothetical protein